MKHLKFFALGALFLAGCATISRYDQYSYMQAVNLKVDSMKLMDSGVESYASHKSEVQDIKTRVEKAYEYEKGRPKNTITTDMWNVMFAPKGALLGGFFALWEESGTLSPAFIQQQKKQVAIGFDEIISLESEKIKK